LGVSNKKQLRDVNNLPLTEQFYDVKTDKFVPVTEDKPYPIRVFPKHEGLLSSEGNNGWYTTQVDNEVITLSKPLNTLVVEAKDSDLSILLNNDSNNGNWYIDAFGKEGVEDIKITSFKICTVAGTMIRWRGLFL
jgi:hypothetical protein